MAGVLFMACIPKKEYELEWNVENTSDSEKSKSEVSEIQNRETERVSFLSENYESPEKSKISKKGSWDRLKDLATSPQPKSERKKTKLEIQPDTSMEEIVIGILKNLKIENYSWIPVQNDKFIHVIFSVAEGPPCEEALRVLMKWGIGSRCQSTLGIIPCAMYFQAESETDGEQDEAKRKGKNSNKSGWNEFVVSVVRSRLAVAQVVESVKGNAKLTFDFVFLILLAGTISAVGLVENSTVSIVASMLISPLMGPILAGTFGTVIHDRKLQMIGVRNELIGLSLTIFVGYFIGIIIASVDEYYGTDQWPTQEMMSRGLLRSLWVGALIALPSGAGIALGLLGDNSGSLIGVAISASLLPPAVNAGLLWALATVELIMGRTHHTSGSGYKFAPPVYSEHLPSDYALLGCVSLSLTLVNIVCIFIAGILVLRIKEVAPRALTDDVQQFWHHDIKVARDYNRSLGKEDARNFETQLAKELAAVYSVEEVESKTPLSPPDEYGAFRRRLNSLYHFSPDTLHRISVGPQRLSQTTWSPSQSTMLESHRRSSVKDLEKLYASLGGSEPPRLSMAGPWIVGQLRSVRGNKPDDISGLSPIREGGSNMDLEGCMPHRGLENHRFTVIPSASDPLRNES